MVPNLNKDELYIIFNLLNGLDLHNASLVCSTWSEVANEVKNKRGPIFVVRNELEISSVDWNAIKREFIDCCKVKPSLHMLFFDFEYVKETPKECCCRNLPLNCSSILIQRSTPYDYNISSIFFPDIPNIKVSTISLNNHPWDKGIYCEELKCLFDESFSNADKLKNIFESVINNDYSTNSAIIIYGTTCNKISNALLRSLQKWFPNKKTSVWGINAEYLAICNHVYNSRICRNYVDCIAVLLSGTDMQSWITILDTTYDDESMIKEFKETIKLKKHAVGFLVCHEDYIEINYAGQKLIQSYFPEIPIFTVFASDGIAKYGFEGPSNDYAINYWNIESTAFIILTYN